jgi:tRNA A-37 threonylcarbamoyl transferase component Bud32
VAETDLSGTVLDGRYQVIEPIAEGAMGAVYRGERLKLGRAVAIKIMHQELPDELASRQRFEREAKLMALLEHPNCVSVIDFGIHEEKPFLVMDLVRGTSLLELLDKVGHVDLARSSDIIRQVLSGLAHAHELGIVHRDIKPANIMISEKAGYGQQVRILDFGLARLQEATGTKLTTGIVVGTPNYMAPEQCKGGDIDSRTDLYACGVMLFEMLTGRKPFVANDPIQVVRKHLTERPPTMASVVPNQDFGDLETVVARALAKSPSDRFESAVEMAKAVEAAATKATKMTAAALFARAVPETGANVGTQQATMSGWTVPSEGGGAQQGGHPGAQQGGHPGTQQGVAHGGHPGTQQGAHGGHPGTQQGAHGGHPGTQQGAHGGHPGAGPGGYPTPANNAMPPGMGPGGYPARSGIPPGATMNIELSDSAVLPASGTMPVGHDTTIDPPRLSGAETVRDSRPPMTPPYGEATVRDSRPPAMGQGGSLPPLPKAAPYSSSGSTGPTPHVSSSGVSSGAPDRSLGIPPTRPTTTGSGPTSSSDRPIPQLPFTKQQLMIGGGGVVALIVLIAIFAGGSTTKSSDAPKTRTGAVAVEEPKSDPVPKVIERANALIASEEYDEAVAVLKRGRKANPDNAHLAFLSGKANFGRLWWTDGIDDFREAIRIDSGYKENPELLKTVLKGFITTPDTDDRIVEFMREIGAPMRPLLEETAEKHPKKQTRARARAELNAEP